MDCSPPGSSVHRILQARILEWVAMPFSRGSSWPRDGTWVSHITGFFIESTVFLPWTWSHGSSRSQAAAAATTALAHPGEPGLWGSYDQQGKLPQRVTTSPEGQRGQGRNEHPLPLPTTPPNCALVHLAGTQALLGWHWWSRKMLWSQERQPDPTWCICRGYNQGISGNSTNQKSKAKSWDLGQYLGIEKSLLTWACLQKICSCICLCLHIYLQRLNH